MDQTNAPGAELSSRRFRVEMDKRGQVHIHCIHGKDVVATIGLTVPGFNSLCQQGLMRKPHALQIGALHDWVQLDSELFSFEKGKDDGTRLEQTLNSRYMPSGDAGSGKQVVISPNAASSTGFDIQFPVLVGGMPHTHRQHLNEESLELLQDQHRCGLLHPGIIIRLMPPSLVFKQRTADGGEKYVPQGPESTVNFSDEDGTRKAIDLSHPLNLLRLSAAELTAVFNHPSINRHATRVPVSAAGGAAQVEPAVPSSAANEAVHNTTSTPAQSQEHVPSRPTASVPIANPAAPVAQTLKTVEARDKTTPSEPDPAVSAGSMTTDVEKEVAEPSPKAEPAGPPPNTWLKEILEKPALRPDWFACLVYSKMAEHFGNSSAGRFGPGACWFIQLGTAEDLDHPDFKGVFLTEKGSLGFLNGGQMARFYNGIAFLGPQQAAVEGIEIGLEAVALDARERLVFVVSEDYRGRFGIPEATLTDVLTRLSEAGVVVMSIAEALASREPIEMVWTLPAEQPDPNDPQALESHRPTRDG